jgi:hypothetical protein
MPRTGLTPFHVGQSCLASDSSAGGRLRVARRLSVPYPMVLVLGGALLEIFGPPQSLEETDSGTLAAMRQEQNGPGYG